MSEQCSFLISVKFWEDYDFTVKSAHHLLRESSFANVTEIIEKYYGNDLLSLTVDATEDQYGLIPDGVYEIIKNNGFDWEEKQND